MVGVLTRSSVAFSCELRALFLFRGENTLVPTAGREQPKLGCNSGNKNSEEKERRSTASARFTTLASVSH